ncbi:MAG: hypothetical protein ACK5ZL_01020, partial [bacterium]
QQPKKPKKRLQQDCPHRWIMSSYEFRDIALILAEVSRLETSSQSRSQESISVMGRESVSSVVKF